MAVAAALTCKQQRPRHCAQAHTASDSGRSRHGRLCFQRRSGIRERATLRIKGSAGRQEVRACPTRLPPCEKQRGLWVGAPGVRAEMGSMALRRAEGRRGTARRGRAQPPGSRLRASSSRDRRGFWRNLRDRASPAAAARAIIQAIVVLITFRTLSSASGLSPPSRHQQVSSVPSFIPFSRPTAPASHRTPARSCSIAPPLSSRSPGFRRHFLLLFISPGPHLLLLSEFYQLASLDSVAALCCIATQQPVALVLLLCFVFSVCFWVSHGINHVNLPFFYACCWSARSD
jgi:hypothetical protein